MGPRSHLLMVQELQRSNLQAAIVALLASAAAGSVLAYHLTRPVVDLARVTQRYGQGERGLRARAGGRDEVSELARVFNRTADQLQLEQDAKQRFLTDVAHELRTPLTVLKSELEAVQDGLMELDADTVPQLLQQVDLLARLVQDLRLLTLAEAGELTLRRVPTALHALVKSCASAFGPRAAARGVRVEVEVEPVEVIADPDRLQQVVGNLLENAIQHAPPETVVQVALQAASSGARIILSDGGPGIPRDHLPHVFERFYRVDPARGRESGGSGLGLAIAKVLVELHAGGITAANRPEGGARFEVHLPLDAAGGSPPSFGGRA